MGACSVLHLLAAAESPPGSDALVLLMLGMALVCLPCATHLILAPSRRTWVHAGLLAAGMLVAHSVVTGMTAHSGHDHAGSAWSAVAGVALVASPAMTLCLALVGAVLQRQIVRAQSYRPGQDLRCG